MKFTPIVIIKQLGGIIIRLLAHRIIRLLLMVIRLRWFNLNNLNFYDDILKLFAILTLK